MKIKQITMTLILNMMIRGPDHDTSRHARRLLGSVSMSKKQLQNNQSVPGGCNTPNQTFDIQVLACVLETAEAATKPGKQAVPRSQ